MRWGRALLAPARWARRTKKPRIRSIHRGHSRADTARPSPGPPRTTRRRQTGVTSLKTMPGLGKSFPSRIARATYPQLWICRTGWTYRMSKISGPRAQRNLKAWISSTRAYDGPRRNALSSRQRRIRPSKRLQPDLSGRQARTRRDRAAGFTHDKPPEPHA